MPIKTSHRNPTRVTSISLARRPRWRPLSQKTHSNNTHNKKRRSNKHIPSASAEPVCRARVQSHYVHLCVCHTITHIATPAAYHNANYSVRHVPPVANEFITLVSSGAHELARIVGLTGEERWCVCTCVCVCVRILTSATNSTRADAEDFNADIWIVHVRTGALMRCRFWGGLSECVCVCSSNR